MAFDLKTQFETNEQLEIDGVWEDLDDEGAGLLIARVGNKAYLKAYQKVPIGVRRQLDSGSLPEGMGENIVCKLLARTILLDWRNLANDGEEIPYNYENALKMLTSYKDFRDLVWTISTDQSRFREEALEEEAKNSKSASPGS